MDMIERVARAIFEVSAPYKDHCCNDPDFDRCPCSADAMSQSHAAIGAMRELSEEMLDAAAAVDRYACPGEEWVAVIDAALGKVEA